MLDFLQDKSEKKVEYIELIYDLIFVYLVSQNGQLLHNIEDGFITTGAYLTYLASSVVILQIWYFSSLLINRYGDEFFGKYKREDATFTTYKEIPDKEIEKLEREYSVTLEKERFAGVDEGDYRVRVFRPNEKIDLYEIQDGRDIKSDDEILISAGYAVENNVKPGDVIRIKGKDYSVAGTFLRPDYLYMVENLSDDYKNVTTFFLCYMTPAEFEAQFGGGSINNKVIYTEKTD